METHCSEESDEKCLPKERWSDALFPSARWVMFVAHKRPLPARHLSFANPSRMTDWLVPWSIGEALLRVGSALGSRGLLACTLAPLLITVRPLPAGFPF